MYIHNLKRTIDGIYVVLTGPCVKTGKPYSVKVLSSELDSYLNGNFAQDAFPDLSSSDREFLISGISPEGWKQIFPEENENL